MEESRPIRQVTKEEFILLLKILGYPWGTQKVVLLPTLNVTVAEEMSDDVVLKKMFASKNGQKIKQLFDGDVSQHNNDVSGADFALCAHLAFWTQKNPAQIERLWLRSGLGQREKTKERQDYRERTITGAINVTTKTYSREFVAPSMKDDYEFLMATPVD